MLIERFISMTQTQSSLRTIQILDEMRAYGFLCQFKDSPMVVPTKQCECVNRFHNQCLLLSFMDVETQVESPVNMNQQEHTRTGARSERQKQKCPG